MQALRELIPRLDKGRMEPNREVEIEVTPGTTRESSSSKPTATRASPASGAATSASSSAAIARGRGP